MHHPFGGFQPMGVIAVNVMGGIRHHESILLSEDLTSGQRVDLRMVRAWCMRP